MLVDQVLDSRGSKGTVNGGPELLIKGERSCGTVAAASQLAICRPWWRSDGALRPSRRSASMRIYVPRIPEAVLEDALLCAKICSYAQGMSLIRTTSLQKGWSAEPDSVLRCWQGGCIIPRIY